MSTPVDIDSVIARTRCWVEKVVIALNLCPFARKPYDDGLVRFFVSEAATREALLQDLQDELERLRDTPTDEIETTLLIHPNVLNNFLDYNDFLDVADALLEEGGFAGEFQIASMHPNYRFAGTRAADAENYTNRSPYPILHLLREDSLEHALSTYARPDKIPERNIKLMETLGTEHMRGLLEQCQSLNVDGAE